jgi:hypothetical protein
VATGFQPRTPQLLGQAFRDSTAAHDGARVLEGENDSLRRELDALGGRKADAARIAALEQQVDELGKRARGDNEEAFVRRLREERDALARDTATMRVRLAELETRRMPVVSIVIAVASAFWIGVCTGAAFDAPHHARRAGVTQIR